MEKINISFEIEKEIIEEFDKIWKEQGFERRSPFLRKLVKKVIDYNRHSR